MIVNNNDIRAHVQGQLFRIKKDQKQKRKKGLRKTCDLNEGDRVWVYPKFPKKKLRQLAYMATIVKKVSDKQYELLMDDDKDKIVVGHDQIVKFDDERSWGMWYTSH